MTEAQLWVGLFFVATGLLLQANFVFTRWRASRNWLHGVTTQAVVTRSRMIFWGGDYRGYWTYVEFDDYFGLRASAKVETPSKMTEGDRISIVYNPDTPKRAALASKVRQMHLERGPWPAWWTWLITLSMVIAGLLIMAGLFE